VADAARARWQRQPLSTPVLAEGPRCPGTARERMHRKGRTGPVSSWQVSGTGNERDALGNGLSARNVSLDECTNHSWATSAASAHADWRPSGGVRVPARNAPADAGGPRSSGLRQPGFAAQVC